MDNKVKSFDKNLFLHLMDRKNPEAISIIANSNLHHAIDIQGRSILHYAASFGNPDITQYLIDNGCEVNTKDNGGATPLMIAAGVQSESVVKILLNANAKIDSIDRIINLLLHELSRYEFKSYINIWKMILEKALSKYFNNNAKLQKLIDMRCPFPIVILLNNVDLTKLMLKRGCAVNERVFKSRETTLHLAVHFLNIENVKLLMEQGAEIDATDCDIRTPIARFKMQPDSPDDKLKILELLIDRGASLNIEIRSSKLKIIDQLLREGDKRTVRVLMSKVGLFQNNQGPVLLLDQLIYNQNPDVFEILEDLYFNANVLDHDRSRLLVAAISLRDVNKVRWLLHNGAKMSLDNDFDVTTMFLNSILIRQKYSSDAREIVDLLLQHDLDVQPIFVNNLRVKSFLAHHFDSMEPILAHLAMVVNSGVPLVQKAVKNIKAIPRFEEFFNLCQEQFERMKSINVYRSVTLHELLCLDKKKLNMYGRNQDFVENYELCMKNNESNLCSQYCKILKFRIGGAINLEQLKEKVALIICKISRLPTSFSRTLIYDIVEYLNHNDLKNMLKI